MQAPIDKDIGVYTQLEHAPDHVKIVIVAGATEAVAGSFSVKNFCRYAESANVTLTPLCFFAWLLQVNIFMDNDIERGVTTVFDNCIGTKKRSAILSCTLPLILTLDPHAHNWTHFIRKLKFPPDVMYIERNSSLTDFGTECSELNELCRFKGLVEITIGKVHADSRIADEFTVTHAMNLGDTEHQMTRASQKCLVCGRPNTRSHCMVCDAVYCSREHQEEDWPRHKTYCKTVKERRRRRVHTNVKLMAENEGWIHLCYGVTHVTHPWLIRRT